MDLSLTSQPWQVKGFHPYVPLLFKSMETGGELAGVTEWMPATVPGGVHMDLYRAGYIPHPHRDMNSVQCEWVENRWWLYRTEVALPERTGSRLELVFQGLDYRARIYWNGRLLGEHEGMYHPAVFDVTGLFGDSGSAVLEVLFEHAPDEMPQIGMTSRTHTQKSRFNYKWDFSTRLVNVGIWDDVLLRVSEDVSLGDIGLWTDAFGDKGTIEASVAVRLNGAAERTGEVPGGCELTAIVLDPDGRPVARQTAAIRNACEQRFRFELDRPRLWYPNGYGEQPLYALELQLVSGGEVVDRKLLQTGIRRLGYDYNRNSPEGALPYTFVVNGNKIYVQGVNMTPLDLLYGTVSEAHYEWLVYLMKKANVNMVRVWGGGIIEKEVFYRLCDRYGIMVWQEFIQSSSGLDNKPSQIPSFLALLERSAVHALKTRRNHVSLTVWSGGNELMSEDNKPSTYDDANLAMLRELVKLHDPQRMFLPTSASGPVEFVTSEKGVSHDVHGQWKYVGNPGHYELYGEADHLFHSEFGVDGASSAESLGKFLSEEQRVPMPMSANLVWRHHGEWWDTYDRDASFFGAAGSLEEHAERSQWIQAEGLRFILEANRRRQFENSGSIIWQLNEPWPNVSCTCLVDYYGGSKMAYYWSRKAFAPLHASLDYRNLDCAIGRPFVGGVYVFGNRAAESVGVIAEVLDASGNVLHSQRFAGPLPEERAACLGELRFTPDSGWPALLFVRLRLAGPDGFASENVYTFSTGGERRYEPALRLAGAALRVAPLGGWRTECGTAAGSGETDGFVRLVREFELANEGDQVALHIRPVETTNGYWMEADGAFEAVFPGERKLVTVTCVRKRGGGLLEGDQGDPSVVEPVIRFSRFAGKTASR